MNSSEQRHKEGGQDGYFDGNARINVFKLILN